MRVFNPKTGKHTTISDRAPREVEAARRTEAHQKGASSESTDNSTAAMTDDGNARRAQTESRGEE